jgi:hypothetical protein
MPVVCLEPARRGLFPFTPRNFCARELSLIFRRAQTADRRLKTKIMKTKIVMTVVLTIVLGAVAVWFASPQRLNAAETNSVKTLYYTCPMHSSVRADKPGDCPDCGMHLVPVYAPGTNAAPETVTNQPVAMMPGCCSRGGGCR